MDSELIRNGRLTFLVDSTWREDVSNLPQEDIFVPSIHLPDPEAENGTSNETLKELDLKWTDLALTSIATDSTLN
ncbi:anaphase-promoting complex subunit 13 [Dermatophagoides farinae]|uniref:Anaphase-promoting complex subunit 13 n=1 Tax=Dermatophagoides farinae TaxID=6954 RepID=A0A9D4P0H8_DERFA|nr:anaphase-promoting complex subunit 13-like [Dermatophagoides farinae]KAH7641747.1 anaphase-promoting complex subunit 13-like protein [Dermatophagoides farinae]